MFKSGKFVESFLVGDEVVVVSEEMRKKIRCEIESVVVKLVKLGGGSTVGVMMLRELRNKF